MPDVTRDISLLVSVARIEEALHDHRRELEQIPRDLAAVEKKLAASAAAEKGAIESFDEMKKERRQLELGLQDSEAALAKYKNDLMKVESNKEYTAMLKEIELKEKDIETKEERLLELMDRIDDREEDHQAVLTRIHEDGARLQAEKETIEGRRDELEAECERLERERPKLLTEVGDSIRRRYQRLHNKLGELAVVRVHNEHCGGCGTQLPPQVAVEVRKNDQIITCQNCGRLLVYYS